ncbi:MAG: Hsp20/alpha crystallin family protein [Planctomycetaceae bacterium]|nr:Hsp20/alpha crystallin family protein [Planctomycetaceae bacterium]
MTLNDSPENRNPESEASPTSGQEIALRAEESSRGSGDELTARPAEGPVQRILFNPPIDIFGTDDGLVLRADLPGVSVERLELQIEDNKLTLFGRVQDVVPENATLLHQEYQVGDFYRSFILSDEVDYERISAKMNHGVLEITLPRVPRTKPRKIPVRTE